MTFQTFDFPGVRRIQLDDFGSGSVTVDPATGAADVVEGSLSASEEVLAATSIRCDDDLLRISLPPRVSGSTNAHLRLGVPAGLAYGMRCASADVTFGVAAAAVKISSGSGDVSLADVGDLDATTASGDLLVARLTGRVARLVSGSGDIRITEAHCPLTAKSGSGDITVRSLHRADLRASSGSGDIAVPSTTGSVDLRSASGSLTVGIADGLPAWLDLNSVTGAVRIALEAGAEPGPGEAYVSVRARTASGEIAIYRA